MPLSPSGHLRLRLTALMTGFLVLLALAAFLGLQVHDHGLGGAILEWTAFLASLLACVVLLAYGARLLGLPGPAGRGRGPGRG
jgi:hypothetical protein